MTRSSTRSRRFGVGLLSVLFIGAGSLHFLRPQIYDSIVPSWVPDARTATLLSGAAEVAGGLGLLLPATRTPASWGLILLLLAVFPANLNMAQHPEKYGLPGWALWARLPLQPLLMWWVWKSRK
ncbi:DoxX family protein [Deinococcus ruber]|uniref:DoxX family membrane protein n=1 Tax=Deinococcus ruber TaxID=1848197 RepID=A0A918BY63_9DEIO|nr:hypothetical protein [Deinococcus ruber]GGQ94734.1 hypothetical protein GCM10008957_03650 [Deinococcus ruber]